MNYADLTANIAALKKEADGYKTDREYRDAIGTLRDAIELIDRSGWESDPSLKREERNNIAWHLADCLGMMGGHHRRLGQLERALEAFERGRQYEKNQQYRIDSSYNTVNAIVVPIESGSRDATSQGAALREAVATLEYQIHSPEMGEKSRKRDRWAYADLGQCRLLLGDVREAATAYEDFIRLSNAGEIGSACRVLTSIAGALDKMQDDKARFVREGIGQLEAAIISRSSQPDAGS